MSTADFQPWLFDDYSAWVKALSDPRWVYDQPVSRLMAIYAEYRTGSSPAGNRPKPSLVQAPQPMQQYAAPVAPIAAPVASPAPAPAGNAQAGQILSQNEIDNLLSMLSK